MNDSRALLIFFVANVSVWIGFITLLFMIVKGRNREKHQSGIRSADLEHAAHRDDADR